ncbi:MAG: glycosyltransferase [Acidobacteria bacterium]|nr:glycosyltransferase [Acidobacteriota bacterium]
MSRVLTPEERRKIFLDGQADAADSERIGAEERFWPLRSRKGLTSGDHFARYLFAAGYCAGKRVLDIACGTGYGSYILKTLGASEVVGVDYNRAVIDVARRAYSAPGIHFLTGDAAALRLAGEPFEVVVSFETLEHLADPDAFLETIRRHLAPDGLFIVSCPHDARSSWVSSFHVQHYTYPEFRAVVARYFPNPIPVAQIHGIASLVLPLEAAGADDLAPAAFERAYLEVGKPVEDSDGFLLLCGAMPHPPQPLAVLTKNLSDFLQEIFSGVSYMRERFPRLEADLAQTLSKLGRANRRLIAVTRALDNQKAYTLEVQHNRDAMYYSRTWQLMLACRDALRSVRGLIQLPLRVARILTQPPQLSGGGEAKPPLGVLAQYLPHRKSSIAGWPANRPLVTIGIPCHNYGRFLRECIASIAASTFQDFEIIVVNDGSTDPDTLAVLAELEQSPPPGIRFRVVHQENQGLAAARNKGSALALGKYVVSLDADDRIEPTYLEKALWALEHNPEYAFCYSLVQMFGAEEAVWKTEPFSLERALRYNHVPTAAVFRKEAWVEAGGFRDELYGQDDWNFWITLGAKGWDGFLIEEPLFFYRKHESSMWSGLPPEERQRTAQKIQSMHAYLFGHGDSREAEAFHPPQDPVVRAALDHPEPPPSRGGPIVERRHLNFGNGKPALLFAIPWMDLGGAEQVVLQVMQGLAADYNLAVVTTLDSQHEWEAEFRRLTPWIYHLARLPLRAPAEYLRELIRLHNLCGLVISGTALAYEALPALKQGLDLWTADIVHNTAPEGYLATAIRQDPYIDCHFAVGRPQHEGLVRQGGVPQEKVRLAPTAADASVRFNPAPYASRLPEIRRKFGLIGGETVLTYTGRLAVEKDVPLFVRVVSELVRRHPDKHFRAFIAGDGPELARIEHEIRARGLQSVIDLLGFCDNIPEMLAVSRFAFLTSRFEGSSITLLEAMSMRQVVLATDVGNIRDVIENGVNGFIVPSREPADFAARVGEVLADAAREAEISKCARRTVLERYELSSMVRIYADAIAQALAERRQPA